MATCEMSSVCNRKRGTENESGKRSPTKPSSSRRVQCGVCCGWGDRGGWDAPKLGRVTHASDFLRCHRRPAAVRSGRRRTFGGGGGVSAACVEAFVAHGPTAGSPLTVRESRVRVACVDCACRALPAGGGGVDVARELSGARRGGGGGGGRPGARGAKPWLARDPPPPSPSPRSAARRPTVAFHTRTKSAGETKA